MPDNLTAPWQPANAESLAKQFSRLGWIGFWLQLALLLIPIFLLIYVLFFSSPESAQRRGIDLSNYLSYGSLVVMVFTTFWFFHYTRVAKRITHPNLRPTHSSVVRTLWVGLGASSVGILFSMLLMMNAVWRLLFVLMVSPQTIIPIAPPVGEYSAKTLSAMDAVALTFLVFILAGELIVLAFSLWLLFRATRPSSEAEQVPADAPDLGAPAQ